MRRDIILFPAILLLSLLLSCGHNVYLDDDSDKGKAVKPDIWEAEGRYFSTANEAIDYIILRSSHAEEEVEEEVRKSSHASSGDGQMWQVRLLRPVLSEGSDGISVYGGQYAEPEELRGAITVPEGFKGRLCIDFGGNRYDFSNRIEHFFMIRGGKEVRIYNGESVIFRESQSPITNPALIVGTRTVFIDEHLIDDRRVGPEEEAPAAVEVSGNGELVITCDKDSRSLTGLGGTFTIEEGGAVRIEEGTVTIYDIKGTAGGLAITGGEIRNPHEIDSLITDAIQARSIDAVDHRVLHGPVERHPGKDASCLESGSIEYWYCHGCGKYYSDEGCLTEITYESTVISPGGHKFKETWTSDSKKHWHECTACQAHQEDIAHSSEVYLCDDDKHWKECSECNSVFDEGEHEWGDYHECDCDGPVKHLVRECRICGAKWNASTPEYLLFDIGIGEARLKAIESTPCGDFYINGKVVSDGSSMEVDSQSVTAEFKPHLNSNINFRSYCYVVNSGSIYEIQTGTKDDNGNYKVSFTLRNKKEHGVNIQANTQGGSLSLTVYLRSKF